MLTPQQPKEQKTFTITEDDLIQALRYVETLAMIQVRGNSHPGIAWAGSKLLDHLTEAKHWAYEMQMMPPMPKTSPIIQPKDFLKKK